MLINKESFAMVDVMKHAQKLYAYVDESGQDTRGEIFIVSIVVADKEKDAAKTLLVEIERLSGKGNKKWTKARTKERRAYFEFLFKSDFFREHLYFSCYRDTKSFVELTIFSTAKAILDKAIDASYAATVFVDGLEKTERHRFASGLRKLKVRVRKVRGVKDESDAFIRLADAAAGLVRDAVDGNDEMKELLRVAKNAKFIREI